MVDECLWVSGQSTVSDCWCIVADTYEGQFYGNLRHGVGTWQAGDGEK